MNLVFVIAWKILKEIFLICKFFFFLIVLEFLIKLNFSSCVPIGSCGGVYCASNAACKYDEQHQVPYCECVEGYIGDGIKSCKQPTPTCNVRNNCGLYATCAPNYR